MKLLHWNVHMWRDPDGRSNVAAVTELILHHSPDVVSLVEVDEPWGWPESIRQVADAIGYSWAFVPSFEYRGQGGFGNALLSPHPLHAVERWQLLSPRLYDGTEPSEQRTLLLARISVADRDLCVGTTHLPRGDPAMRAEAATRLLDLLKQHPEPWAVCGDFNQPASDWLADTNSVGWTPAGPTYPTASPTEAIDYCLTSGLITAEAEVLNSNASDHLPILVTGSVAESPSRDAAANHTTRAPSA